MSSRAQQRGDARASMPIRHVTILAKKGNLSARCDRTSSGLPFLRKIGCSADGASCIPGAR